MVKLYTLIANHHQYRKGRVVFDTNIVALPPNNMHQLTKLDTALGETESGISRQRGATIVALYV